MSEMIVEWAPFRLAEGVAEQDLLEASSDLQDDFLSKQHGFVRRELLQLNAREWCDLVYWRDAQAAHRAMEEAAASQTCRRYFALMIGADHIEPGEGVQHLMLKRSYIAD